MQIDTDRNGNLITISMFRLLYVKMTIAEVNKYINKKAALHTHKIVQTTVTYIQYKNYS